MAENDLGAADSLISQAEALGVQYNIFYMGDTPKKARRDLERRRNAAPAKPSTLSSPRAADNNKKAPTTDPFAGRVVDPPPGAPNDQQVTPLPNVDSAANPNQSPLRVARLALAVGDVRRAGEFVARARAMRLNYQPADDNPEKVEIAIRKYQELSNLDKNTEAYARSYAHNMVEQADGLARWGELDEAERLAGRAAAMRLVYGPFEQNPQDVLQRIAEARRQAGVGVSPARAGDRRDQTAYGARRRPRPRHKRRATPAHRAGRRP